MSAIVLSMLDSSLGHPLQTWTFNGTERITLGRLHDNDIVIADPRVSRTHAYLQLEHDRWSIISLSQQKIYFQGQLIEQLALESGHIFRLGKQGTNFRFDCPEMPPEVNSQTINLDSLDMPELNIDFDKMHQEVTEIVEADYFLALKKEALKLREQRRT